MRPKCMNDRQYRDTGKGALVEVVGNSYDGLFDSLIDTARGKVNSAVTGLGKTGGEK